MQCDCIKQVEDKLKKHLGDSEAKMAVGFVFKDDGGVLTVPSITASYRKKKQDGTFNKKEETISIIPSFCPFCGEAINEDGLSK